MEIKDMSDRELLESVAKDIAEAKQILAEAKDQILPVINDIKNSPIAGMLFG